MSLQLLLGMPVQEIETCWVDNSMSHRDILEYLFGWVDRPRRLLACACARRIWPNIPDVMRAGIEVAEKFSDGKIKRHVLKSSIQTSREFGRAASNALRTVQGFGYFNPNTHIEHHATIAAYYAAYGDVVTAANYCAKASIPEAKMRQAIIDNKNGNYECYYRANNSLSPFYRAERSEQAHIMISMCKRPNHQWDERWRTATVKEIAHGMYQDRENHLPILADALEDAGATADILNKLRTTRHFFRGNFIVDQCRGAA